jgi:two-component system, chemotaxis family, protein-glutamate methylesterase/glutaminase
MAQDLPPIKVNCPDCSGVISLDRDAETGHLRYVCQIGHAYSVEEIAVAKEDQIENAVWTVLNLLEHAELIYGHLLEEARRGKLLTAEAPLDTRIRQSEHQRRQLRAVLDQTRRPSVGSREADAETLGP